MATRARSGPGSSTATSTDSGRSTTVSVGGRGPVVGVAAVAVVDEPAEPAEPVDRERAVVGVDLDVDDAVAEAGAVGRRSPAGSTSKARGCPARPAEAGDVGDVDQHCVAPARSPRTTHLGRRDRARRARRAASWAARGRSRLDGAAGRRAGDVDGAVVVASSRSMRSRVADVLDDRDAVDDLRRAVRAVTWTDPAALVEHLRARQLDAGRDLNVTGRSATASTRRWRRVRRRRVPPRR